MSPPSYGHKLLQYALVCATRTSVEEGARAIEAEDTKWLGTLNDCVNLFRDTDVRVLECDRSDCTVRLLDKDSSMRAFTLRRYL